MLKIIKKNEGVNPTEKRLISLAQNAFLGLWSYPNVYSNEGFSKNKTGKEVCDLLVVFENNVIIFSDKDTSFNSEIELSVAWKRWFRASVKDSIKQLYGAEKFIREHNDRLFIDASCETPFPVRFGDETRFFLISVTNNITSAAQAFFDNVAKGSSGTLINVPYYNIEECMENPFYIGDFFPGKTFVHVLDEISLKLILTELDTISDFLDYLKEKERVIRNGYLGLSPGEEDTLGAYLLGEGTIIDGASLPENHFAVIAEHEWISYTKSINYQIQLSYKKGSFFWDETIERFSNSILNATVGLGRDSDFHSHEETVRQLAAESRRARYYLAKSFLEKFKKVPSDRRSSRLVESIDEKGKFYIYIFLPRDKGQSYDDYRLERLTYVQNYSLVAKYKYPEMKKLILIATESKDSEGRSEDIMYCRFDSPLSKDERDLARRICKEEKILNDIVQKVSGGGEEQVPFRRKDKIGRNDPCYCGSGLKYKKCHG